MEIFKEKERKCWCLAAASLSSVQSKMFCLQPEWQTRFHQIKSGLFTCQTQHIYWQCNFSLSASHCFRLLNSVIKIWKEAKWRKKLSWFLCVFISALRLHSGWISDFSRESSSFTLAPLLQLSGWFHSDATQTPLIVSVIISSVKAELSLWHQLLLISRIGISSSFAQISFGSLNSISSVALWPDVCQRRLCSDMIMSQMSTSSGFDSSLL